MQVVNDWVMILWCVGIFKLLHDGDSWSVVSVADADVMCCGNCLKSLGTQEALNQQQTTNCDLSVHCK